MTPHPFAPRGRYRLAFRLALARLSFQKRDENGETFSLPYTRAQLRERAWSTRTPNHRGRPVEHRGRITVPA